MRETITTSDGRTIELPTEEEDREIAEAALADSDAQPWTEEELAMAVPVRGWRYPRHLLTSEENQKIDRAAVEVKAESK